MVRSIAISVILMTAFIVLTTAEKITILAVPKPGSSGLTWSWMTSGTRPTQWSKKVTPERYYACDRYPSNSWLRSNKFQVGDARRVDVTVKYAVNNCSYLKTTWNFNHCKENIKLHVYKTSTKHGSIQVKVPEPSEKPELYELFGTTNPQVLTVGNINKPENTETYSFLTNAITPYYYLAIQYTGGCFAFYGVTISYSLCPSLVLSSSLVKLPQTISPANGSNQVSGSCANHAQLMNKTMTLYGYCKADGEWSTNMYSGECWCDAGYGKYSVGSGAECKECPLKTYQNSPRNSKCRDCPMNSVHDTDRKKCKCQPRFYRTEKESVSDNCTAQPSAPKSLTSTFFDATFMTIQWSPPFNLGGRSDVYYEVECKQCNAEKGQDCTKDCTDAVITHTPSTTRMATVKHLSAYTYYQIKVFAKNGVTSLAEKNNEKAKYSILKTKEIIPEAPVVTIKVLNSTSVLLSWPVQEIDGITYYQVTYYPVGEELKKIVLKTTESPVAISNLTKGIEYIFQVRAGTKLGIGRSGDATITIPLQQSKISKRKSLLSQEALIGTIIAAAAVFIIVVIIIVTVCLVKRKQRKHSNSRSHNAIPDLIPMSNRRMFIDPSNYGSPLEAMRQYAKEIDLKKLKLKNSIGEGEFADVYRGILTDGSNTETVAVKMLKPRSTTKNKTDFILEASIMGQFKHPNVIELKGVVTRCPDKPMMIVTEFMENGSLEHFLKVRECQLTILQLVGIARGVAAGMAYLTEMNFIHRDLAARNILVADNLASKISDFGLSRELDNRPDSIYLTQGGKIPIRWTAPEAIQYRKFSSASDVWSFGILVWEIMSFAERPYWEWSNDLVMERVESGFRLPTPMHCPKSIHNLMLDCWEAHKNKRPKFPEIVQRLEDMICSPDKLNDDQMLFVSGGAQINYGEVTSVEEWLVEINMRQYTDDFVNAGYRELDRVMLLEEDELKKIGVSLIGHRNKIKKSIKAMKGYYESPDFEIDI